MEETEEARLKQRFKMIMGNHYQNKRKYNFKVLACVLTIFLLSYSFIPQPYSEPTSADYDIGEPINKDDNYYIIKTKNGYDFYEYPDRLIEHIDNIGNDLKDIKIYQSIEEVQKNE